MRSDKARSTCYLSQVNEIGNNRYTNVPKCENTSFSILWLYAEAWREEPNSYVWEGGEPTLA
jgi:hypothetical protein